MKSILVTGGAGFFGKAFVRHALANGVERIRVISRDEHKHALMREEFGNDDRLGWFVGCVRDRDRLRRAMEGVDLVVHAAALKRIETGYYDPTEIVKTNVLGAVNVIEAAIDAKVKNVVALSTDKAWQGGISPYGQSKALAEGVFISANNFSGKNGTRFASVRYGNIWCSTGSLVPNWMAMIKAGAKKVPVTDPDCTRFFMLIDEAVSLVWNTAKTMKGGELVIPETLPAYRVGDVAEALGVGMDIKGLPAWERKHEGMRDGLTSDIVRRMTVEEIRALIPK